MHSSLRSTVILTVLSAMVLSACHKPERIAASSARDSSLNCQQIRQEINKAERAKAAAREHDQFEMRYILIVPAIFSLYNFSKAEKAAQKRLDNMHQLYDQKRCAYQPNQPATPAPSANPFQGGQQGQPFVPPAIPQGHTSDPNPFPQQNGGSGTMAPPRNFDPSMLQDDGMY